MSLIFDENKEYAQNLLCYLSYNTHWKHVYTFQILFLLVPKVLVHCAEFIEDRGIVDGIYRLGGIASNIQRLR